MNKYFDDNESLRMKQLNEQENQKYAKAQLQEGLKYINRTSLRQKNGDKYQKYSLFCSNQEFKKYGIGLFFYYDFLKKLCFIFWILAIISIPSIYSNATGDGLNDSQTSGFAKTQRLSLANQPDLQVIIPESNANQDEIKYIQLENDALVQDFYEQQDKRKLYVWIPDFIYTLVFFFFIVYYTRYSKNIDNDFKKTSITPRSYAIEITGIPPNLKNSNELRNFLNNLCTKKQISQNGEEAVVEVSLAKNFEDTLYLYKKEENLNNIIKIEQKRNEILNKESSKKLRKVREKQKQLMEDIDKIKQQKLESNSEYTNYQTIKAYVIFNKFQQKQNFVALIDKYNYPSFFKRFICCCLRPQIPKEIKFRDIHQLYVNVDVDQPSNIKWENLDMTTGNQLFRKLVVFFALILILAVTSVIILIANLIKPEVTTECSKNDLTFEQVKQSNELEYKNCFCYSRSWNELANDRDLLDFCWKPYIEKILLTCFAVITSVTIVVINIILQVVIKKFTEYLRYQTFTNEIKASTLLLFFCTFINTAILTLLLNSDIFGFVFAIFVTNPIPPLKDLQSSKQKEFSPDFDRDWYSRVGTNIILTILITTVSPHVFEFLIVRPFKSFCNRRKAKKAVVQQEMNQLLKGPDFDLTKYYVNVLNIVFVCLFFSSGQPLLLILGALSLTTQYWCYKYNILRVHQKPPAYDGTLNHMVQALLPWALVFHLGVGVYMYGSPLIFPTSDDKLKVLVSDQLNSAGVYDVKIYANENQTIQTRAFSTMAIFVLFLMIFFLCSLDITLITFFKQVYKSVLIFFCKRSLHLNKIQTLAQVRDSELYSYLNQKEFMSKSILASYDIRQNEKYSGLIAAMNENPHSTKSYKNTVTSHNNDVTHYNQNNQSVQQNQFINNLDLN